MQEMELPVSEELESFLQQRPTLVFGRDARELLILLSASSLSYGLWQVLAPLQQPLLLLIGEGILSILPFLCGCLLAFVKIASYYRIEDWIGIRIAYSLLPKRFLYQPSQGEELQLQEVRQ